MKPIKRERYDKMVDAALDLDPTDDKFFAHLAEAGSCHVKTARKAWREGWPHKNLEPIRDRLRVDALQARAMRATMNTEVVTHGTRAMVSEEMRARLDAVRTRSEEAEMVRLGRRGLVTMLGMVTDDIEALSACDVQIRNALDRLMQADDGLSLDDVHKLVLLKFRVARTQRAAIDSIRDLLAAERLLLGEPGEITQVRVDGGQPAERDLDDLHGRLGNSLEAIQRIRNRKRDDDTVH